MQDEDLPGARLRRLREEKGLSREEVSRDLRLSMAYLKALEEDDYGKLPEPPFVKGYLRNYARLLRLSGEEFAALYQTQLDRERAHAEEHRAQTEERSRPAFNAQWRLPALIVLVVILVLALAWWLWPAREPAAPLQSEGTQSENVMPGGDQDGAGDSSAMPSDDRPAAGEPAVDTGDGSPDAGPQGEPAVRDEQGMAPGAEAGQGAPAGGEAASAGTAPAEEPARAPAEQAPASAGGGSLAMKFSRVCWIKVVDNTGKTLTQGRQSAGSAVDLDGQPPFRVTIGDAGAVSSVVVNGKPGSLPSQRSGDVLHVTLP